MGNDCVISFRLPHDIYFQLREAKQLVTEKCRVSGNLVTLHVIENMSDSSFAKVVFLGGLSKLLEGGDYDPPKECQVTK